MKIIHTYNIYKYRHTLTHTSHRQYNNMAYAANGIHTLYIYIHLCKDMNANIFIVIYESNCLHVGIKYKRTTVNHT